MSHHPTYLRLAHALTHASRGAIQNTLIVLLLLFALSGCSGGNDETAKARAGRLRTEASLSVGTGHYRSAEKAYREAIELNQQRGDVSQVMDDRTALGHALDHLGEFSAALEQYSAAWEYYRQTGNQRAEILTMLATGDVWLRLGNNARALSLFTDAATMGRLFADSAAESAASARVGLAHGAVGDLAAAHRGFAAAWDMLPSDADLGEALVLIGRAAVAAARTGREEEALERVAHGRALAEGDRVLSARFAFYAGEAMRAMARWSEAALFYRGGLESLGDLSQHFPQLAFRLHVSLGLLFGQNFSYSIAREHLVEAYGIARQDADKYALAYVLIAIAECDRHAASPTPSHDASRSIGAYLEQATGLLAQTDDRRGEAIATYLLARTRRDDGDDPSVETLFRRAYELAGDVMSPSLRPSSDDALLDGGMLGEIEEWADVRRGYWFEPYAVELARHQRADEAFHVLETGRSRELQRLLDELSPEFRSHELQQDYKEYQRTRRLLAIADAELTAQRRLAPANRDGQHTERLRRDVAARRLSLSALGAELAKKHPRQKILFESFAALDADRSGTASRTAAIAAFVADDDRLIALVVPERGDGRVRSAGTLIPRDLLLEKARTFTALVSQQETRPMQLLYLEKLSRDLYDHFIQPIESSLSQRLLILPPAELESLPFHALSRDGRRPLIEFTDVSYAPALSVLQSGEAAPRAMTTAVGIGNPLGKQWSLDFDMRDLRSFFRDATVMSGAAATEEALFSATGDMLQLATEFHTDPSLPQFSSFVLSSGSITVGGVNVPIERLPQIHPFPVVSLVDIQQGESGIRMLHAALLLIGGTSRVIATLLPSEPRATRFFNDRLNTALAGGATIDDAYRLGLLQLRAQARFTLPSAWGQFYKYGN